MGSSVEMHKACADPDSQFDIDLMAFDYLSYIAINAVLNDCMMQQSSQVSTKHFSETTERAIDSVDGKFWHSYFPSNRFRARILHLRLIVFLAMMKEMHPATTSIPVNIDFRLRLLTFVTLYCRRSSYTATNPSTESLAHLRYQNQSRAKRWHEIRYSTDDHFESLLHRYCSSFDVPVSRRMKDAHRSRIPSGTLTESWISSMPTSKFPDLETHTSDNVTTLLDLLPSFMSLSAARAHLNSDFAITEYWMHLAGQFMLQACVEAILLHGQNADQVLNEAFAWGYVSEKAQAAESNGERMDVDEAGGRDAGDEVWDDEEEVNEMFRADPISQNQNATTTGSGEEATGAYAEDAEVEEWASIRNKYISLVRLNLFPSPAPPLITTLTNPPRTIYGERN